MLKILSPAFKADGPMPKKYACDGEDINPPLLIEGVPESAKSLVLIMDDPDASNGLWTHWIVFNIDPKTTEIEENSVPDMASQGSNSSGESMYQGPCPPSGEHRYFFRLYAIDRLLNLPDGVLKEQIEKEVQGALDSAELMGFYSK